METHAREYVEAARELQAAGKAQEAEPLWRRAAEEPLKSPTEPGEPWSEHYYFKALALDHVNRNGPEERAGENCATWVAVETGRATSCPLEPPSARRPLAE